MVKTKIVCTIGPASDKVTALRNMIIAGMDVARLNFSHGNHIQHSQRINLIRQLNCKYRRHIKILQDLEGFRIRIGKFKDTLTVELKKRQKIALTNKNILGNEELLSIDYKGSLKDIKTGSLIYIDDGNIALLVKSRTSKLITAEVVIPGILKEHKGINIPGANLKFDGLTDKDKIDLQFGIENKVDYIAQSFVRNAADITKIRDLIKDSLPDCRIIAKIENRQGIKNIDKIIDASDGIMIARGDMGVSIY